MKKLFVFFLLVFSFLSVRNNVVADWWTFPTIAIPKFTINTPTPTFSPILKLKTDPGIFEKIVGSTPTPTISPTSTPTPTVEAPTNQPVDEETLKVAVTSSSKEPNISTSVAPSVKKTSQKAWSNKDLIFAGVAGLLMLIVFIQAWPKIKKFLHEKTA